jgi:predicted aconitase
MAKYKVGQMLNDIEDGSTYKIVSIAPQLDNENEQRYLIEIKEIDIDGVEYWAFGDEYLDKYAKLIEKNE